MAPHRYIVREGEKPAGAALLVDGLCYRQKTTIEGARQILSVHLPGDFLDLENALLAIADHNVQALTQCEIATIDRRQLIDLIDNHPRIGRALWIDTLIDGSIFREWIVNVGRRDARSGMAHLLCELAKRLEIAGMASVDGYRLPLTQEQLADALGLTSVHVNRVLKELDREKLIVRDSREIRIPDWERLRKVAGFSDLYLHLDQITPFPTASLKER